MLLTLIINSLNCTMLLTAIQTQKPGFESSRRWPRHAATLPCTWGVVSMHISNRNFGFRKESQTFKIMALIIILSIR